MESENQVLSLKLKEYTQRKQDLDVEYDIQTLNNRLEEIRRATRRACEHKFEDIGHDEDQCVKCGLICC